MINIRKIILVFSTIILIISVFLFANTEGLMDSLYMKEPEELKILN